MLEGLDKINWKRIQTAYGSAENLPNVIRDLASDKREVYEIALKELHERINHQDTIYEVTRYAVPFLIELLSYPSVLCKYELLYQLEMIVQGCGGYGWYSSWFPRLIERDILTHRAVSRGEKIYIKLLQDTDAIIRVMAIRLLASVGDFNSRRVPYKVIAFIKNETNSVVKSRAFLSLGLIISKSYHGFDDKRHKKFYNWMLRRFYSENDLLVRHMVIAALVYVSRGRDNLRNIPVDGLKLIFRDSEEIIQHSNQTEEEAKVWYFLRYLDDFLTVDGYRYKVVLDLVDRVAHHSLGEVPLLKDLLTLVFGSSRYNSANPLSVQQRLLLDAIVNSKYFWLPRTPKHNLPEFGLPSSQDELRKLLESNR